MRPFFRDRRGAAAVEFALIAPIMLLMYFGMAEITQGLLANRRASHVTAAIGDLVAQYSTLTDEQVDDIFTISTALMAPMSATGLSMRVTSIAIDKDAKATVRWSRTGGATSLTALQKDATVTDIPADLVVADEALVRADTEYVFNSPVKQVLPNALTFRHTTYLKPRGAVPVELKLD
jgi:Flp pilus assembly protein TadG